VLSRTLYRASCEISPAQRGGGGMSENRARIQAARCYRGMEKKMEKSDAIPPERNNVRGEGREGARNERDEGEGDANNARGRQGGRGIVDGKTGGSAPTEFFGGITDLYFTPDLPSDVYVFNILDASARVRTRTSASMHPRSMPNAQRSTNSYLPPFILLPLVAFSLVYVFLSFLHKSAIFYPLSSRSLPFSLSLSFSHTHTHTLSPSFRFPLTRSPRVPLTFSYLFREFPRLFSLVHFVIL